MSYLDARQIATLLTPIKPHRVSKDKKGYSNVEAYEIRAHLNRVFGFARWSQDVLAMELLDEKFATITDKAGKDKDVVTVAYRAQVRLTVCAPDGTVLATYTEWAVGDAPNFPAHQWPDAHDFAAKTAESQALKRCAVNLGDQFGLSLYRGGSTEALVGLTLVRSGVLGEPDRSDPQDKAQAEPTSTAGGGSDGEAGEPPVVNAGEDAAPPSSSPGRAPKATDDLNAPGASPHEYRPDQAGQFCWLPGCGWPKDNPLHVTPDADEFRTALLAATEKSQVTTAMRQLEMRSLGEETVGDANGEPILLRDLASRCLKALASSA